MSVLMFFDHTSQNYAKNHRILPLNMLKKGRQCDIYELLS